MLQFLTMSQAPMLFSPTTPLQQQSGIAASAKMALLMAL